MSVEIEKNILNDLVSFKLKKVQELINDILNRWNTNSIEDFLEKSKKAELVESENDAIDLKQLIEEEKKLLDLQAEKVGE